MDECVPCRNEEDSGRSEDIATMSGIQQKGFIELWVRYKA